MSTVWGNYTAFTPHRPSQKGTTQQHWHPENGREMGIGGVARSVRAPCILLGIFITQINIECME